MALRRPLLLLCVLTIVLGISYEVSRPVFPEADNTNFKTPFTPRTPVPDGSSSSTAKQTDTRTDEKSRPPFTEVEDADSCTPFRARFFLDRPVYKAKQKPRSPDAGIHRVGAVDRGWAELSNDVQLPTECRASEKATHDLNFNTSSAEYCLKDHVVESYAINHSKNRGCQRTTKRKYGFSWANGAHGTKETNITNVNAHAQNETASALPPDTFSLTTGKISNISYGYFSARLSKRVLTISHPSPPESFKRLAWLTSLEPRKQTIRQPPCTSFETVWDENVSSFESEPDAPELNDPVPSPAFNDSTAKETDKHVVHGFYVKQHQAHAVENVSNHRHGISLDIDHYPVRNTVSMSIELVEGFVCTFFDDRKFAACSGQHSYSMQMCFTDGLLEPDDNNLDAVLMNISLYSFCHEKIRRVEVITSTTQRQLKLVSLCIMLARTLFCPEDLRRRLLQPLHMAMTNGNSIHDIIKTAVMNILTREGLPNLQFNCTANGKPLEHILPKSLEYVTPSLPMKDRRYGHLSSYLGMQDEPNGDKIKPKNIHGQDKSTAYAGFDLEKDTHHDSKWNGLSQYFKSFIPRHPVVSSVFPASFLPNPGGSVKDSMSHVLNRLASLNSLPASCDISRVRLAEAGFYYDNSKTVRDASNVHEVVCYSCGLAYGQWKKGDNPTTIHVHIKPDCEYIRSKNASQSTPLASSSHTSTHVSEDRSSLASSGVSMPNDNATLLSTSASSLSSGHGSLTTESMQQASMPHNSLSLADSGLGTGSFSSGASGSDSSHHRTPFENRSAATRSDGGDLATDCSAIAPQPRSSNQSTFSGLARDSAVSSQLSYQSSYSTSRDTSRARALDLDDRPPLDMTSAVYPQFCRHQERRATFSTWPLSDLFRPDDLVMQGFYYAGYADCLRCFYCGVGLKSWAEDDDVMVEHIRWRPSCGYVLNTKGRQYVDRILNSLGQVNSNGEQSNRDSSSRASQPNSEHSTTPSTNPSTTTTQPSTTSMTSSATSATAQTTSSASTASSATTASASATASQASAAAASTSSTSPGGNASREVLRKVEDMGFSKDAIARAVRHFQQAGKTKISADALVEKIIELDADDSGNSATDGNPTHRDGLQTDGPEGASNYGVDADIQRAQRILTENERLKARQKCKICKEAKVGMIFLPCGHILACTQCGSKTKNCTHCGEFIRATANVYLS